VILLSRKRRINNVLLCCLKWLEAYPITVNIELCTVKFLRFYYSTDCAFYHIRAKERAKYATLLNCRIGPQKYGLKRREKMAAQNEPNFALFTCKARKFSMSWLVTFSILTNQINDTLMVSFVFFMSRGYYAIVMMQDRFRKLKAKILENGGMVEW